MIGGLIAFLILMGRTKISKFTPAQATSAIVVSYYWHFVDIVWIGLFTTRNVKWWLQLSTPAALLLGFGTPGPCGGGC